MPVVTIVAHPTLDASKVAAAAHEAVKIAWDREYGLAAFSSHEIEELRARLIEGTAILVSSGVVMRGGKPAKVLVRIDHSMAMPWGQGLDEFRYMTELHKHLLPLGVAAGEITGMKYDPEAGGVKYLLRVGGRRHQQNYEADEWRRLNRNTAATKKPAMHMQKQQPAMDERSRDMLIIVVGIVVVVVASVALTFI